MKAVVVLLCLLLPAAASAQNTYRLLGRVVTDKGEPIANAEVAVEAFYGKAAGAVSGQRTFAATSDKKGAWNVMGIRAGVWLFEVRAPGYYPESVALPIQILASSSSGQTGMALTWQLVLKPFPMADETRAKLIMTGAVPEDASADDLAGAARLALQNRDTGMARALFQKALERDPGSYRAALGIATTFMLARDFDSASRVFDAARSRTHDKDEIKFITVALSDLATIMVK
ncbi:MAG TPA: tetratricopeptide repeat protein [Vicinamibacterales bacterium]|nr:tetratricopeptide repeat protein [Vicinamibacterales bacterium]